jgi:acetyl esterase
MRASAVAINGQSSYDPLFAEKIGIPRPNFERHNFFLPFYDITKDQIDTPEAHQRYKEMAPITYLTKDDPPALLTYSYANEPTTPKSPLGLVVHHPLFGLALKQEMDKLGLECLVPYRDPEAKEIIQEPPPPAGSRPITVVEFFRKHFEAVGK